MTTINSNGGLFNQQNSTNIPLNAGEVFEGSYSSTLNYSTIEVSVKCDTFYSISIIYSPDSNNDEYVEMQEIEEVFPNTFFYKFEPKMRYFKIRIENIDTEDQQLLSVNCIQKSSFVYSVTDVGNSVSIANPLNLDGSVRVGGDLNLAGSVDANITNEEINVNVTNSSLAVTNNKLDLLQFDAFNNLNTNLNNINSNFVDVANNGLKVSVQNSSLAVSNGALSSMSFNLNRLSVLDSDANSKLENIYNLQNTKSSTTLWASAILAGGFTNVLNLNQKKITNISFLGTQDSNGNVLTIQFSNDNIAWYDSQYSYSFGSSVAGDFGFNIQCCPQYLRVKSANACYLILNVSFC